MVNEQTRKARTTFIRHDNDHAKLLLEPYSCTVKLGDKMNRATLSCFPQPYLRLLNALSNDFRQEESAEPRYARVRQIFELIHDFTLFRSGNNDAC